MANIGSTDPCRVITFSAPGSHVDALEQLVKSTSRTRSSLMQEALKNYLRKNKVLPRKAAAAK